MLGALKRSDSESPWYFSSVRQGWGCKEDATGVSPYENRCKAKVSKYTDPFSENNESYLFNQLFSCFFLRHFIVFFPFSLPFSEVAFLRDLDHPHPNPINASGNKLLNGIIT